MAHDSGFSAAVRRLMVTLRFCRLGFLCLLTAALPLCGAIAQAPQDREPVRIRMFITAPEYADAIHTLIDQYHALNPNVTIVYETAQSDYPALLKTRINAGECPDIFATTSGKEVALYQDFSYDLTGTPAAAALPETSLRVLSANGRVYAFNIVNNYFGILYNRAIFNECGIAEFPATLDALETACETIAAHGYRPFTTGFSEWWVFKHIFQHFLNASSPDPAALVADFVSGRRKLRDFPQLYNSFFRLIDLAMRYGDASPLETDVAAEQHALAGGEAAMMLGQGAWVESDLLALNPNLVIGFNGYPVSDLPAQCRVVSGPDQALHVYRDSPVLPDVLAFVNWWLTSEYGQSWFCDVCHVIPGVRGAKSPNTAIALQGFALASLRGAGPVSISYSTDGFHQAFGKIMQAYAGGSLTRDQACDAIEQAWVEIDGTLN